MRLLITRPAGDAQAAAGDLRARGHEVLACPLTRIEKTPDQKLNLAATQGFIVTDGDGARALAEAVGVRTFPVFCESAGTTAELTRLGFKDARSADGDASALARLIERSLTPKLGGLVYVCSTSAPVNLSAMLSNMGFAVRMAALYAVTRNETLPKEITDALKNETLDGVVFFTADDARAFAQLVQRANLEAATTRLIAIVAAPVVAAPLTVLKFARVVSAPRSDVASVIAMADDSLLPQPEPEPIPEPEPEPFVEPDVSPAPEPVVVEPTPEPEPEPEIQAPAEPAPEPAPPEFVAPIEETEPETPSNVVLEKEEPEALEAEPPLATPNAEKTSAEKINILATLGAFLQRLKPRATPPPPVDEPTPDEPTPDEPTPDEPAPHEPAAPPELIEEPHDTPSAENVTVPAPVVEHVPEPEIEIAATPPPETENTAAFVEPTPVAEAIQTQPSAQEADALPIEALPIEALPMETLPAKPSAARALLSAFLERLKPRKQTPIVEAEADREPEAQSVTDADEPPRAETASESAPEPVIDAPAAPEEVDEPTPEPTPEPVTESGNEPTADVESIQEPEPEPISEPMLALPPRESVFKKFAAFVARKRAEAAAAATPPAPTAAEEEPINVQPEPVPVIDHAAPRPEPEPEPEPAPSPVVETIVEPIVAPEPPKDEPSADELALEAMPEPIATIEADAPVPDVIAPPEEPAPAEPPAPSRLRVAVGSLVNRLRAKIEQAKIPKTESMDDARDQPDAPESIPTLDPFEPTSTAPPAPVPVDIEAAPTPLSEPVIDAPVFEPEPVAEPEVLPELEPEPEMPAATEPTAPEPEPEPPQPEPEPVQEISAPEQEKSPTEESPLGTMPPSAPPAAPPTDESVTRSMAASDDHKDRAEESTGVSDRETMRMARGGGRSARLLAEDAADARALNQRFKVGGGETAPEPEPAPEEIPAAATAARVLKQSRGMPRFVSFVIVIAILAAGIFFTASWWAPQLRGVMQASAPSVAPAAGTGPDWQTRADKLAADVTALNTRIAAVEQRPAAAAPDANVIAGLTQRLTALEAAPRTGGTGASPDGLTDSVTNQARQLANVTARVATLEAAIGNIAKLEDLATRLSALEGKSAEANSVLALADRLASLEKRDAIAATALVLATAQLRDAAMAGRAYTVELETVIQLAARAGVEFNADALKDSAAKGLARSDALNASFLKTAPTIVRAGVLPDATASWFRRALDRILSIVSLRPFGSLEGTTPGAVVARAEQALGADNLAGAVTEMESLTGAPLEAAAAWLAQAKTRVLAEKTLDELSARSVGAMSAAARTQPSAAPASGSPAP